VKCKLEPTGSRSVAISPGRQQERLKNDVYGHGLIPPGDAVQTGAGRLPFRAIIHVAGISLFWRSSERAIRGCVRSALALARQQGYRSIAFPLIGAGIGGYPFVDRWPGDLERFADVGVLPTQPWRGATSIQAWLPIRRLEQLFPRRRLAVFRAVAPHP